MEIIELADHQLVCAAAIHGYLYLHLPLLCHKYLKINLLICQHHNNLIFTVFEGHAVLLG